MKALVFCADHSCREMALTSGGQPNANIAISQPVGTTTAGRVRNLAGDVRTIQTALNSFPPLEGGPNPPLEVDGVCGRLTKAAIVHFQTKWDLKPKGSETVDGVVDLVGPTIDRLRAGRGRVMDGVTEFFERIPDVMGIVTAASAAVEAAIAHLKFGPRPGLFPSLRALGELAVKRADKHFHIGKTRDPIGRLEQVRKIYFGMQTAIGYVPRGLFLAVEEPPESEVGAHFFTQMGSYYVRDNKVYFDGTKLPINSIYVCPKGRALSPAAFAYGMIHELAHFVGPAAPGGIDDFGYFHKGTIAKIPPHLATRNADSYAQFAYDAIGKPDFNIKLNYSPPIPPR